MPSYHTLVTRREGKILISGNCTANASGAAFEFCQLKEKLPHHWVPSRLFIYWNERVMEGDPESDGGAQIRDGIKSLATIGACSEDLWPYDITKFAVKPPQPCFENASKHLAVSYQRIDNTNIGQIKTCLASGYPIVFGFTVYASFESQEVASTGIMPMPQPNEEVLGGHAVLCVGYDDSKQMFIVRNSWGSSWGDQGYFHMPYAYMTNPSLSDDFWTIRVVIGNLHS
jgi:C1A family cysteine protease